MSCPPFVVEYTLWMPLQVFDVPLAVFIRQRAHVHNDISYFGTPSFRVHTFACVPTIALSLGPTVALGIEEALRTGSFVEDKEVGLCFHHNVLASYIALPFAYYHTLLSEYGTGLCV